MTIQARDATRALDALVRNPAALRKRPDAEAAQRDVRGHPPGLAKEMA